MPNTDDDAVDIDRLRELVAGDEPEELRTRYLMVPDSSTSFLVGSGVRLLAAPWRTLGTGLTVPNAASGPFPIDYVKTFITLSEYFSPPIAIPGVPFPTERLIESLAVSSPIREAMADLAILNHLTYHPVKEAQAREDFMAILVPEARDRLINALARTDLGGSRAFLSRQAVLAAMRETLLADDGRRPAVGEPVRPEAVFLSHAIGEMLYSSPEEDERTFSGLPRQLALEVLMNELFYRGADVYSSIDRYVRLWEDYGGRLSRTTPRRAPAELLEEATGLTLLEMLGLGFAFYANRIAWEPGTPVFVNRHFETALSREKVEAFLRCVAHTPAEFSERLASSTGSWQFLPFEDHPILDLNELLLVLDEGFLIERVLSGLYWFVHDHESSRGGEPARQTWAQAHGEMVEMMVLETLAEIAPPIVGGGSALISEGDLASAYPGRICDAGIDFGAHLALVEVVAGQVTIATRLTGDFDAFKTDTARLVMTKIDQLNQTATAVLSDPGAAGLPIVATRRILPILVNLGTYPVNPMTMTYVEQEITARGWLQDPRIAPLAIVDVSELEMLEGLASQGVSFPQTIIEWRESGLQKVRLLNWLIHRFGQYQRSFRPARMEQRVAETFERIRNLLELPRRTEEGISPHEHPDSEPPSTALRVES